MYLWDDSTRASEMLTTKLSGILNIIAWLTPSTKKLMDRRNKAQELASHSNDQDDWREYKNLRHTVNSRIKMEKREWEKKKMDSSQNDSTKLWKNVKTWLNWNNSGPPTQLFSDGNFVTSPAAVSGTMNNFFLNKVRLHRQRIPNTLTDPLSKLRETLSTKTCTMKF